MNNEPVAWMYERPNGSAKLTFVREPMAGTVVTETPLYTYPAKTLTVTFEDCIAASLEQDVGYGGDLDLLEFAKAILRKAQEK